MAGTPLTLSSASALLKRIYPSGLSNASNGLEKAPLTGMLSKRLYTNMGGQGYVVPILLSWGGGIAHEFARAQADFYPGASNVFLITVGSDYVIKHIDGKARAHLLSDKVSFARGITLILDEAFNLMYQKTEHELFRQGYCTKGRCLSGYNGQTITLYDKNSVFNFHIGQKVCASATEGAAYRTGTANFVTITGIDYNLGTLTTASTAWNDGTNGITSFVNGDYLMIYGDSANAGAALGLTGLSAWLTEAAPTDTLHSCVRTADSRLGGHYIDLSSYTTAKEVMQRATFFFSKQCTPVPKTYIVPPNFYQRLLMELDAKETVTRPSQTLNGKGNFGYSGIEVMAPGGKVEVFQSIQCPDTKCFALNLEDWFILTAGGDMPRILNFDTGGDLLVVSNADEAELRVGHYSQLGCDNISASGSFKIADFA